MYTLSLKYNHTDTNTMHRLHALRERLSRLAGAKVELKTSELLHTMCSTEGQLLGRVVHILGGTDLWGEGSLVKGREVGRRDVHMKMVRPSIAEKDLDVKTAHEPRVDSFSVEHNGEGLRN